MIIYLIPSLTLLFWHCTYLYFPERLSLIICQLSKIGYRIFKMEYNGPGKHNLREVGPIIFVGCCDWLFFASL